MANADWNRCKAMCTGREFQVDDVETQRSMRKSY